MFRRSQVGSRVLRAVLALGVIALPARGFGDQPAPLAGPRGATAPGAPGPATVAACRDAAIRVVRFANDVTIDEIRVHVAAVDVGSDGSDGDAGMAPVIVKVATGRFARRLFAAAAGGQTLAFSPGLRGHRFEISLDGGVEAGACVARVVMPPVRSSRRSRRPTRATMTTGRRPRLSFV